MILFSFYFIDHSSRNALVNYDEIPGLNPSKFQNFLKLSQDIKEINRKISAEKSKIVKNFIKMNEKQEGKIQETSKGHLIYYICIVENNIIATIDLLHVFI